MNLGPPGLNAGGMPFPNQMMRMGPGTQELPYPKRTRFDEVGPRGQQGVKSDSVFYKTRLCTRFQEGTCTFGERCNYAHGEAELRQLAPEGHDILAKRAEREAMGGPAGAGVAPSQGHNQGAGPQQGPQAGASSGAYRLNPAMCRSFINTGECSWGDRCKFTHGASDPRELRASTGGTMRSQMGPMGGMGSEGPEGMMHNHPMGMMMEGNPMNNMDMFQGGMGGMGMGMGMPGMGMPMGDMGPNMMHGLPFPGGMMARPMGPRPPPPRPPIAAPPGGVQPLAPSAGSLLPSPGPTPSRPAAPDLKALAKTAEEVPMQERLKAMCVILGVGPGTAAELPKGAMAAAQAAIQTGLAFEGSVYADALQVYV